MPTDPFQLSRRDLLRRAGGGAGLLAPAGPLQDRGLLFPLSLIIM